VESRLRANKELARYIVAAAFLFFLLAEWSAHAIVHINNVRAAAIAVTVRPEHPDHHGSLVLCNDSGRNDQQLPNVAHDLSPAASMPCGILDIATAATDDLVPTPSQRAGALSRPPDPHFRPPETA